MVIGISICLLVVATKQKSSSFSMRAGISSSAQFEKTAEDIAQERLSSDVALDLELHRNFPRWRDVPNKHLRAILNGVEPVSCSNEVLKRDCQPGQREVPREPMLQLLERHSGIDPNSEVGSERRLSCIAMVVWRKSSAMGRPLKDAVHPVNWAGTMAAWRLEVEDDLLLLASEDGSSYLLPASEVKTQKFEDLYIESPWSVGRAMVKRKHDPLVELNCRMLAVCGQAHRRTPPKKQPLGPNSEPAPIALGTPGSKQVDGEALDGDQEDATQAIEDAPRAKRQCTSRQGDPATHNSTMEVEHVSGDGCVSSGGEEEEEGDDGSRAGDAPSVASGNCDKEEGQSDDEGDEASDHKGDELDEEGGPASEAPTATVQVATPGDAKGCVGDAPPKWLCVSLASSDAESKFVPALPSNDDECESAHWAKVVLASLGLFSKISWGKPLVWVGIILVLAMDTQCLARWGIIAKAVCRAKHIFEQLATL